MFLESAYFSIFISKSPRTYPNDSRVYDCSEAVFLSRLFMMKSVSVMSCDEELWCLIHWALGFVPFEKKIQTYNDDTFIKSRKMCAFSAFPERRNPYHIITNFSY